jgi:hypothetical protein
MMQRDARGRFLRQQGTAQLDQAYHASRQALRDCLNDGFVDAAGLHAMQTAMASTAPNKISFGADRFDELMGLLDEVEKLPVRHPPHAWHHTVPYPYTFKWDGPWLFVLALFAGGFVYPALWVLAGFIALMRCVVWLSFRFPMTMVFFTAFFIGLLGRGRGRRW